ncbi:MAG: antitoxin family protein [Acidimicrobiia bacterium]
MARAIRARFSRGKIEPLEPVDLIEGEEIDVTITERAAAGDDLAKSLAASAGAWRGLVDGDELLRNIAQDRASVRSGPPSL